MKSGSTTLLLATAIAVLVAYVLLWFAYAYLRYGARDWLTRIFDPGSYPGGSLWDALGQALHARVQSQPEPVVVSPTRTYTLGSRLAVGDLCDLHLALSGNNAFVLKSPRSPGHERLIETEQAVVRSLLAASQADVYAPYFPEPVEAFWSGGKFVSVMRWRHGFFSAAEIRDRYPAGLRPRHIAWMLNRTLEALGFIHRHGWVHGAVLPPHLLFRTQDHALQLVDWIHATRIGTPLCIVSRQYKSWYPPECHRRERATAATDVYLAAKSMIWLAGGDPLADRIPNHVPQEFATLLRRCLMASPSSRPGAWALHQRFREVLEDLYGTPKFCHLTIS